MKRGNLPAGKPARGRPRSEAKVAVAQRLLDATEGLLQYDNHIELTERKVAAAAGVDDRMIHYYFGDKDGLICAVIARYCDAVSGTLIGLDSVDPRSPNVTRDIYKILVGAYFAKPWIARILASELAHSHSPITTFFTRRYGVEGEAPVLIRRTFERLIACGVYDPRIDVSRSVLALFLMSVAPVMVGPLFANVGAKNEWFMESEWLDFVADLFDRKLRRITCSTDK